MEPTTKTVISVQAEINLRLEYVWKIWTTSDDIRQWNNASPNWHTPKAENDLKTGGRFLYRMEAKDGTAGFDFSGVYNTVDTHKLIEYTLDDGRKVKVSFSGRGNVTRLIEDSEAEQVNSVELQRAGWQSILTHFKEYAESV